MGGDAGVGSAHAGPAGAQCAVVVVPPCRFGAFCGDGAAVAVVAAGVFEADVAGVDGFAGVAVAVEQPRVGGAALCAGVPVAVVVGESAGVAESHDGTSKSRQPWDRRLAATSQYRSSVSMPMARRLESCAAIRELPEPAKGSRTR